MDFISMIYEIYGTRKMEGIFISYLVLSLILKQLLFAFFLSAGGQPFLKIVENEINFKDVTEQIQADEMGKFQMLLFVFNLLETENTKNIVEQELY